MNQYSHQYPATGQGLIWVSGESAARSYLVAPNCTVLLMDNEDSRFYIKSADACGMPTIRTFEYVEIVKQATPPEGYVTRQEYDELLAKIEKLAEAKTGKAKKIAEEGAQHE